jgi:hypothetical protein
VLFVLLEIPSVGYVLPPQDTAEQVAAFGRWLNGRIQLVVATLDEGGLRWAGRLDG